MVDLPITREQYDKVCDYINRTRDGYLPERSFVGAFNEDMEEYEGNDASYILQLSEDMLCTSKEKIRQSLNTFLKLKEKDNLSITQIEYDMVYKYLFIDSLRRKQVGIENKEMDAIIEILATEAKITRDILAEERLRDFEAVEKEMLDTFKSFYPGASKAYITILRGSVLDIIDKKTGIISLAIAETSNWRIDKEQPYNGKGNITMDFAMENMNCHLNFNINVFNQDEIIFKGMTTSTVID